MSALTFTIRLLEPLLIADSGAGDPNSAISLDYIPGSALRGAFIARYQQLHSIDDLADNPTARHLFFEGAVRYLNAYPLDVNSRRMLPIPLSWYWQKDREDDEHSHIYDFAFTRSEEIDQPKLVGKSFCSLNDKAVTLDALERQINLHIYRDERNEQNKEKDSVFRYEALAAGQTFEAVILADNPGDLETIHQLLTPLELSLGRSHQAGYGRVRLENILLNSAWQEYQADDEKPDKIIVTCLSDVLLRDSETGSYINDLSLWLKQTFEVLKTSKVLPPAFTRPHLISGFNRTWGLPLPQTLAIKAGSVFIYEYQEDLLERLRQLEATGIGERRAEGFGRIAVNWQQQPELSKNKSQTKDPAFIGLNGSSKVLAQQMSARILRAKLDAKLAITLDRLDIQKPLPTNAQLSRLRQVLRLARRENKCDLDLVCDHLNGLKKTAANQFDRATVEGMPLKEWLITLIKEPEIVWTKIQASSQQGPDIGGQRARLDDPLAQEYALRLIDKVLHKASKK